MTAIVQTNFNFPGQVNFYKGKVRDVYTINNNYVVMVATDRISAFDYILPKGIPFKGQVLNLIASKFLDLTRDIVPNWKIASPHPNITIGKKCDPYKIEMVVRGYLTGHAWREYKAGKRILCGVSLPEGLKEHDKFPAPIITPATKADEGHDEDISREEIIAKKIVPENEYKLMEKYALALFNRGTEIAREKGLILVDTKYEFGKCDGEVVLIDEVHTPDSSRYFYLDGYEDRQKSGLYQKQLSKEYVREWLIENGFQGKDGQKMPDMSDDFVNSVTGRYIELFEMLTGNNFNKGEDKDQLQHIEEAVLTFLDKHKS